MEQFDLGGPLWKLFLVNIIIVSCNAAADKDQDQYITGLYNASDNVVILNATTFKSSVYGDTRGWLVEFYNSWCGYCFRFAPTWKAFATDVQAWKDIVVIAVIDCADEDNNQICREYEIMHYPMLKYFSVNAHPSSMGVLVEKHENVDKLKHALINRLEKEQEEGRHSLWPNITPYRNYETTNIWNAIPDTVKYFFLIFEITSSHLGAEVILDMRSINTLRIRRVTSDNELLCETNKVTTFPSIIVLSRTEPQKFIKLRIPTREGTVNTIKEYMISKGESLKEQSLLISHNEDNKSHVSSTTDTSKQLHVIKEEKNSEVIEDYLYQLDLENALRYSVNHEISLSKIIEGEKMDALKRYLNALAAYFPLRQGNFFLQIIRDVVRKKDSITGEEFSQLVKSVEEEMSPVYSGTPQWVGCKGSTTAYRGYPCGLWTMFHMLTINFSTKNRENIEHDPTEILRAIHGYVKNFFGCADCSQHFVEMAAKRKIFQVLDDNSSILWLWRAHNEVNERLAGDDTEDPKHKKVQYPTAGHCSLCRYENGSWNEDEVLRYLRRKYSYTGINYYGSNFKSTDKNSDKLKIRQERLTLNKYTNSKKAGWDFTIFDISICVVLYVASATILILVCIKFAVKRGYRKKAYVSLLGKV